MGIANGLPVRLLESVVTLAEAEGERLREEFYRPGGPRGSGSKAQIDLEIEERLRAALQALVPCDFLGEETGLTPGTLAGYRWIVDPHDGTSEFLRGRRGSAISIALLRRAGLSLSPGGEGTGGEGVVIAVVHSPHAADRGADTIAWAEGMQSILRNGEPVESGLSGRRVAQGEFVWATASSALRPETWSRAVSPARYIPMPSIAYRLARVAAGDGVATVSTHGVNEYDVAAGMALVLAAGGVLLDAEGREVVLSGALGARVSGVFAGAPEAAKKLAQFDWRALEQEPKRPLRIAPGFPRPRNEARLARAQGCLLGQLIGDGLGSLVEFRSAAEIARDYPDGVRYLAEGGTWNTIAGQPTDDGELALTLARTIARLGRYDAAAVFDAYRAWMLSRPFDIGATTERGLLGLHTAESESDGSLMRVSPIGIWAAGDPQRAAGAAREDSALTHPNPVCLDACAAYAAAIAAGIAGAAREAILQAALAHASKTHATSPARAAIERGAAGERPADFESGKGRVLTALQNAFCQLLFAPSLEEGIIATVRAGGDTDTNAAIAGALLGAAYGKGAFPARWILPLLACRPLAGAGALRPRAYAYWPDDTLDLAEALIKEAQ